MNTSKIVIGLNYGDEGKGLTTSFLCSQSKNPIVARFNGGHQAGHTVSHEGKRHVFSSFGSGTLQNVPTYWSSYCTFSPTAFLNELEHLVAKSIKVPDFYLDPLCPITTPYDFYSNREDSKNVSHGTVGVGFGTTLKRHENFYKLYAQDMFYPEVFKEKLKNIAKYYNMEDFDIAPFLADVAIIINTGIVKLTDKKVLLNYSDVIFEGAQGVLLDMDFGFFPNVTRSNTTSKNALEISPLRSNEIYYITRSYLTRHGAGFLPGEKELPLINNELETNVSHDFQGNFRTAELDLDLLNYSLKCDSHFSEGQNKNLVITCMDQYPIDVEKLLEKLEIKFNKVFLSYGDSLDKIKQLK
jgi:adenylosuccinate synthase